MEFSATQIAQIIGGTLEGPGESIGRRFWKNRRSPQRAAGIFSQSQV